MHGRCQREVTPVAALPRGPARGAERACRIRLEQDAGATRLEVADGGQGGTGPDGNGLRAMRERIEGLGGTLEHQGDAGTRIAARLPRRVAPEAAPLPCAVPSTPGRSATC